MRLEAKLNIFQQLLQIEFHKTEVPEGFTFMHANLKNLNAQRNTIIHGQWTLRSFANGSFLTNEPGRARADMERKDIVAHRKKRGKQPPPIPAKQITKVAELMSLNRQLLAQLFFEHFADRVRGLAGLPAGPKHSSAQLQEAVRKRAAKVP
jgi:hypothetical protein